MTSRLNPYLSFNGDARQAMQFYQAVLGGDLVINTYGESHMAQDPSQENLVMHAMLTTANGFALMGSDHPPGMDYRPGNTCSISLSGEDEPELRGYWDRLTDGASVTMPLAQAPWGDHFGMLTDRFGVSWMVNIAARKRE